MDRLDYYEILPSGMEAYMSHYGRHISKPMYKWAVSMMRDRNDVRTTPMEKEEVLRILKANNVNVERNYAYDVPYVFMMGKMDYFGSSINDEAHLSKFVKDYLDDVDGSATRAFDELWIKLESLGIPIDWEDML